MCRSDDYGIKFMGQIDDKAVLLSCKQKFTAEGFSQDEAKIKALELYSFWEDKLKNPE